MYVSTLLTMTAVSTCIAVYRCDERENNLMLTSDENQNQADNVTNDTSGYGKPFQLWDTQWSLTFCVSTAKKIFIIESNQHLQQTMGGSQI